MNQITFGPHSGLRILAADGREISAAALTKSSADALAHDLARHYDELPGEPSRLHGVRELLREAIHVESAAHAPYQTDVLAALREGLDYLGG